MCTQYTIERSQADPENVLHNQLLSRRDFTRRIRNLFQYLDTDGSGGLSFDEFSGHFNDECIQAYLAGLNLETYDASTLFKLIDRDNSGIINAEEFVTGCFRMRGAAQSIEVAVLSRNTQKSDR